VRLQRTLDPLEPLVGGAPAGADEVDEQCEIVDTGIPLPEQVGLDPLQPADDLVHQAAHLGEMLCARLEVLAQAVLDRAGEAYLHDVRGRGQRFDLRARPSERSFELSGIGP